MSKKTDRQFTEHIEARLRSTPEAVVAALQGSLPKRGMMGNYHEGYVAVNVGNAAVVKDRNIRCVFYIVPQGGETWVVSEMTHAIIHTRYTSELLGRDQHLAFLCDFGLALKSLDTSAKIYVGEVK
jgi:hypothetical protein